MNPKLDREPAEEDVTYTVDEENALTNWVNEPSLMDLKQDLQDAKPDVDTHIAKVDGWLNNLNITGAAKRAPVKGKSSIVPKLIRKHAEWRYASLSEPFLSTSDMFDVDPVTFEDKESAEQNALVLNNQFNTKIDKTRFIDEYIRTAVDEGTVIVRVGWEFIESVTTIEVPEFEFQPTNDPVELEKLDILMNQMEEDPDSLSDIPPEIAESMQRTLVNRVPTIAVQIGTKEEKVINTLSNKPTLEICNYKNVSIDPTCLGDIEKANFLGWSFESSKSELRKDGKYSNIDKINVEGSSILNSPDHDHAPSDEGNFNFKDDARKKFVVQEYWGYWDIDKSGELTAIVAAWVGNTLIRLEENPYPDKKIPFVTAQYLPVRRSIYGEPDGELLEDNQKISGAVTRGMLDVMGRSANGQMATRKDVLDITNKRKFDKGEDYEFNGGVNPNDAFFMHKYPEIPRSAEFILNQTNSEAESLTGVKAFAGSQGLSGNSLGESVGGQKNALDAASKRELGILRRLASGVVGIGRKMIAMNGAFLDEEEVIRVTNDTFVPVRKDDLAGNFDLRLTISTPEADEAKAKELAFMLQTTTQAMGPAFSQILLAENAKLRKMPQLAKKIEEYAPEPDPLAQEKAMLEIELLKAQIAEVHSQTNENNSEAALDQAKIRNLESDSNLKDLDLVETASGTKQERELQKTQVGNQAALDGKIVDSKLRKEEKREEAKNAANTSSNSQ